LGRPPTSHIGRQARQPHAHERLPHDVVEPVDEAHARHLAVRRNARRDEGFGEHGPTGLPQQRAVQVEERRPLTHGRERYPLALWTFTGPMRVQTSTEHSSTVAACSSGSRTGPAAWSSWPRKRPDCLTTTT